MSYVTLYKHTFCDFEAHQSIQGYINLTHTHKYFQVIQFMSLLTQKYEIHDINWLHCLKKHVVLLVIETLINIGLPQQSFWCNIGSTADFSLSELYN